MKLLIRMFAILTLFGIVSCKKSGNSGVSLSDGEKELLGKWNLQKQIIEQAGQPTIERDTFDLLCYMDFQNKPSVLEDESSPIYSNTKFVDDHKDCTYLWSAWKIGNDGKLLLASLDTVYANILFVSTDSLALKMPFPYVNDGIITYELSK